MIHFVIYKSHKTLPNGWEQLVSHDIFLQINYLKAVEEASPSNISWYYVGIFKSEKLVGVAIVQRVQLYVEDIFRNHKDSCFKERLKHYISKILKGNVLVLGNLMHTGQHGLFYKEETISQKEFIDILFEALYQLKNEIKSSSGKRIRTFIFKDYFEDDTIHLDAETFASQQFHKVSVQPNMIMTIKANWTRFEDYQTSLTKKYRSRLKTARKKAVKITKKELNLEDVKHDSETLFKLYKNVSDNAKINTFILPENHFYSLKKFLKDDFKVFGYYLNDELIGFYTLIINKDVLETYFLGYSSDHQYNNQMYLNMLYDMAQFAIDSKMKHIIYARTAMEIKSSVGAEPEGMVMYMKHTNKFLNAILKTIFSLMNPSQQWEERHPFN